MHGLLIFALTAGAAFVPVFRIWPLPWMVPLAAYAVLVAAVPLFAHRWCSILAWDPKYAVQTLGSSILFSTLRIRLWL